MLAFKQLTFTLCPLASISRQFPRTLCQKYFTFLPTAHSPSFLRSPGSKLKWKNLIRHLPFNEITAEAWAAESVQFRVRQGRGVICELICLLPVAKHAAIQISLPCTQCELMAGSCRNWSDQLARFLTWLFLCFSVFFSRQFFMRARARAWVCALKKSSREIS